MSEEKHVYECACPTCGGVGDITVRSGSHPNIELENVACPDCGNKHDVIKIVDLCFDCPKCGLVNVTSFGTAEWIGHKCLCGWSSEFLIKVRGDC